MKSKEKTIYVKVQGILKYEFEYTLAIWSY